ncbi:uncharacterized protein CCOS01_11231 [Colletotrichum costaricense]|uniref:Uncharacterized protein n=1 Tax=Colletotrichum costaricense TaxID=1209916 RepID=A0AAJ0DX38_9PEZI|nr:uncharacterized protein CCOS01_11231 [Colletotrichum costaricense]KAK1519580.1 hypothetical protein CCOS01_11231 [Colletotrichum costaricense]
MVASDPLLVSTQYFSITFCSLFPVSLRPNMEWMCCSARGHLHLPGFPWLEPSSAIFPVCVAVPQCLRVTVAKVGIGWGWRSKVVSIHGCHQAQHRPHPGDDGTRDETWMRTLHCTALH